MATLTRPLLALLTVRGGVYLNAFRFDLPPSAVRARFPPPEQHPFFLYSRSSPI